MACGLAFTEYGGCVLFIETRNLNVSQGNKDTPGSGQIKVTGSLGEVMKESVLIAQTCAKNFLSTYFPGNSSATYLDTHDIHVHVPEGATPKVNGLLHFLGRAFCGNNCDNSSY